MLKVILSQFVFLCVTFAQPPQPPPGGGAPGQSSRPSTYNATYTLNGGTATLTDSSYSATSNDTSAIWVTAGGLLSLINPNITTRGNTSSQDNSSFYGLNAAVLATAKGQIAINGGTITTTGTGANAAFAVDSGSSVELTGVTIDAKSDGAHAVMATLGGRVTLTNVNITTAGQSSSAIATDRGSGTIVVTGGVVKTSGGNSAGLYSTGDISATGVTFESTGAEMAVIEGANSIMLTNCNFTSTKEKWGVMIYQSFSGDAEGNRGVFTMTGGSLNYTAASGPLFYVNNTTAVITLKGVTISNNSGVLLNAAAGNWGTSGSNGGVASLTADGQELSGDVEVDAISAATLILQNGSSLTGALLRASIAIDETSKWSVTADSKVKELSGLMGVAEGVITNVQGNGYTVLYDADLEANAYLGKQTYSLSGGGTLAPATSATIAE